MTRGFLHHLSSSVYHVRIFFVSDEREIPQSHKFYEALSDEPVDDEKEESDSDTFTPCIQR